MFLIFDKFNDREIYNIFKNRRKNNKDIEVIQRVEENERKEYDDVVVVVDNQVKLPLDTESEVNNTIDRESDSISLENAQKTFNFIIFIYVYMLTYIICLHVYIYNLFTCLHIYIYKLVYIM